MVTAMPESKVNRAKLDFLVSATAVAVMMTAKLGNFVGSGTLVGAVKVTVVLVEFAGIVPVSAVQSLLGEVVGFPAESTVVVLNWHVQVTSVFVLPLTMPVKVTDCETMMAPAAGLTITDTTLVLLLPPQPANASRARAHTAVKSERYDFLNFVNTRTPKVLFTP